jgi:hypothetical protein
MMTTNETGRRTPEDIAAGVARVPITLDDIREIHDRTTWPAIQELKRQRDELIREALAHGDLTHAEVVASGMVSDGHLFRIRKGQTSGATRTEPYSTGARVSGLRAERVRLQGELERLGGDLNIPLEALGARTQALADRLATVEAELNLAEHPDQ